MKQLMTDDECKELIGIGGGQSRCAYSVKDDSTKVIKEAMKLPYFTNVRELFIWNAVKNTELAQIFGECHAISESGRYLVMERLDITDADKADTPDVADWVRDVYPKSFGRNSDGIKLRDYGNALIDLPT